MGQGLDSHRHMGVLFEDVARRRGLALICIDRPGRGKSDPLPRSTPPPPAGAETGGRKGGPDSGSALSEAIEAAVVDTVRQARSKNSSNTPKNNRGVAHSSRDAICKSNGLKHNVGLLARIYYSKFLRGKPFNGHICSNGNYTGALVRSRYGFSLL